MEEQFVTYDIALKLKGLGYDGECFGAFNNNQLLERATSDYWDNGSLLRINKATTSNYVALAPLWQQAFDWLEMKHNLFGWVTSKSVEGTNNTIYIPHGRTIPNTIKNNLVVDLIPYSTSIKSYDANKICLEHLIGIVESRLNKVNPDTHIKQELIRAYSIGKTIQSNHSGKWEDFVPQNQVDRPNFDYGNIDNWRIKP